MNTPMSVYVPVGMLGYGFPVPSLVNAMRTDLSMIGVDAGSVDPGPYYLGSGRSFTSRSMVLRDLDLLLEAVSTKQIPLVIGSAGGSGGDPHLDWTLNILNEISKRRGLHLKVAAIHSEQDAAYLKAKLRNGYIRDFETGRDLTSEDIDACSHIVAQMGVEPLIAALEEGADVVVAGRAFDTAIVAALPILRGFDRSLSLHMGKLLECGSLIAVPREHDGVIGHLYDDHFVIEPADPAKRCTVDIVSAHMLYERANPYRLGMPGGTLELDGTSFDQVGPRTVRVRGGQFTKAPAYLIKLEGSALMGYRTVCLAGARDPSFIEHVDDVLQRVAEKVGRDLESLVAPADFRLGFKLYGRDAVMGDREPQPVAAPQELGVMIEVVAKSQEIADTVCALARSASLHMGYERRLANAGNLAFPSSPAEFVAPPVYEFRVYHLMEVADPSEPFSIQWSLT
jgi:Acyclic terpene utilisation family protein AtuA